eukprot:1596801-Rhodomonas_salina.2
MASPVFNIFTIGTDSARIEFTSKPGVEPIEWAVAQFTDKETHMNSDMTNCTQSLFHSEYPLVDEKPPALFLMEFDWRDCRNMSEVPGVAPYRPMR